MLFLGAVFIVLVLSNVILTSALRGHRIDLSRSAAPGSGPSWSWQRNVFIHAQYDARGRAMRRWILVLLAAQAAVAIVLVVLWVK